MKGKIARSTREMPSAISILLLGVAYFKGEGFSTSLWPREGRVCERVCVEHDAGARPEEDMKAMCACLSAWHLPRVSELGSR